MYESYFGFSQRPFAATPDRHMFVALDSVQESLEAIERCVRSGDGVAVLTAPAGMGKTLVCLKLVEQLSEDFATVFLANSNLATSRALLQAILYELGHPYAKLPEQELRLRLSETVKELQTEKQGVVLVIDEAHLLGNRLLNELRAVTNLAQNGRSLFRVVFSGQLTFEEKLALPELQGLNERIDCHVSLEPLTRLHSADYLHTRLQLVGAETSAVFTPEAVEMIAHVSDGSPRCLNQLADHSLLLAYVSEETPVSADTVREALDDLKQLPLNWNEPLPVATPLEQMTEQLAESSFADVGETAEPSDDNEVTYSDAVEFGSVEVGSTEAASVEVGANSESDQQPTVSESPQTTVLPTSTSTVTEESQDGVTVFEVGSPESESSVVETDTADELSPTMTPTTNFADIVSQPVVLSGLESSADVEQSTEFVEEEVVDRYARIDAGAPATMTVPTPSDEVIDSPSDSLDSAPRLVESKLVGSEADGVESFIEPSSPDRTIETLLPLLSEALSPLTTLEADEPDVSEPQTDIVEVPDPIGEEPSIIDDELEEQIGSAVFDVCLETQAAIESRLDKWLADQQETPELRIPGNLSSEPAFESRTQEPQVFDIVQPEPNVESQATESPETEPTAREPDTRYDRLFSQLRRRRRARQA